MKVVTLLCFCITFFCSYSQNNNITIKGELVNKTADGEILGFRITVFNGSDQTIKVPDLNSQLLERERYTYEDGGYE